MRTQDLSHEGHTAFMTCRYSGTTENSYLNVCDCMYWHCMLLLGGGGSLDRRYIYWALLIPSWDHPFKYTRRRRSFKAVSTKKVGLWP